MRYDFENGGFWRRVHKIAGGADLDSLDRRLGLAKGTLGLLEECGAVPGNGILARLERYSGVSREGLISGTETVLRLEVPRKIFVLKGAEFVKPYVELENVTGWVYIDRPAGDKRSYVAVRAADDSMSRAHIHKDDTVIVRCQAVADDGDIVVASVNGETLIRRYHSKLDVIWLSAEGYVGESPAVYSDCLSAVDRKIAIRGKVVSVVRDFDS